MADKPSRAIVEAKPPARMIIDALPEGGYVLKRGDAHGYDDEAIFASQDLTAVYQKLKQLIYVAPGSVS